MIGYIDGSYRGTSFDRENMDTTNVRNQDAFIEVDTGKIYFYDEEHMEWVEFGGGQTDLSGGETN